MNYALVILLDDNFIKGFLAFWESFITNNSWFESDLVIFDAGLSEENKNICRKVYDKIIFEKVIYENYDHVDFTRTHDRLKKTFYFIEVFRLRYDKIIVMDTDLIIIGDIKDIFDHEIWMVSAVQRYDAGNDILGDTINSGVFTVPGKFLNDITYKVLLELARPGAKMPDQSILNVYFKNEIYFLPKKYNAEKRFWKTKNYHKYIYDILVWHFVGLKPWECHGDIPENEKGFEPLENIWTDFYNKAIERIGGSSGQNIYSASA